VRWLRRTPKDLYGESRAARTVAVTTARRAAKQGVLWGLVFGGTIAASASAYTGLFPTRASRTEMARTFEGTPRGRRSSVRSAASTPWPVTRSTRPG
jgi:hypothetical protein